MELQKKEKMTERRKGDGGGGRIRKNGGGGLGHAVGGAAALLSSEGAGEQGGTWSFLLHGSCFSPRSSVRTRMTKAQETGWAWSWVDFLGL